MWHILKQKLHKLLRVVRIGSRVPLASDQELTLMAEDNEKLQILRRTNLFNGLTHDQLTAIYQAAKIINVATGEILIKENDAINNIIIVVSGALELVKQDYKKNVSYQFNLLRYGDVVGDTGLVMPAVHFFTIQIGRAHV